MDDERGKSHQSTFVIRTCDKNCGPGATYDYLLTVEKSTGRVGISKGLTVGKSSTKDSILNVYGTIEQNGVAISSLIDSSVDSRVAKYERELDEYKTLLSEMKKQNDLLAEKVALLEQNQTKPLINAVNKLAREKEDKSILSWRK